VATTVTSDVPTLLLSGALDAITAPANAAAGAAGLSAASSLEFVDSAHDVMIWSPECAVSVMHSFLDQPDDFDASCVASLRTPIFSAAG
jgi:pimeloyl-ACP methyl ester carboxylesterase